MIEQETEILTIESYQEYRELGGCFTPEDYQLVKDIISLEKVALPESPHTKEMERVSSNCSVQVTPQEKLIFSTCFLNQLTVTMLPIRIKRIY